VFVLFLKTFVWLNSQQQRHTSVEKVKMDGDKAKPALLTQTCNLPNFSLMNLNIDKICSSSLSSQRYGNISPELHFWKHQHDLSVFFISGTGTAFLPCLASFSATFLPIPTEAPVTSATLLVHLSMLNSFSLGKEKHKKQFLQNPLSRTAKR